MAEVIDWSPVDESNNSPPPVGAPEHHAPSATNNIMRAMMGSIRRWYDSVNTQLANYLPLTGGTVTGHVAFTDATNGISIGGISLTNLLGALYVHNPPEGGGGISVDGSTCGYAFADRGGGGVAPAWAWYANAGLAHLTRLDSGDIISATLGQVWIAGNLAVSGNIVATGSVNVAFVNSTGGIAATGAITCGTLSAAGNIGAAGSVNGAFFDSSGGIDADGSINAGGNITASGTVAGNTISANSVNATSITGGSVNATSITAGASGLHSTNGISTNDTAGGQTYALYTSGSTSYFQFYDEVGNANRWEFNGTNGDVQWRSLNVVHWVMRRSPIGSSDNMCFNALGPVGGNGAYYDSSDRRFKEDIEPAQCGLDAVLRLAPVSFRRIGRDDREVGFIAQDLREVVPEAVRVVGIPLPDGTGGPEDVDPTLGVDTTPIIAALVNAMKEVSGRISILEGKRHE